MELNWGLDKKRKHEDEVSWGNQAPKKRRVVDLTSNHPMIYSINSEVHFSTLINKETIEEMIKEISTIISANKKKCETGTEKLEITYVVDSPGGCVLSVFKFVDFVKKVKKDYPNIVFKSVITGLVASAGTIMCAVADTRQMMPRAYAMIHELSSGNSGKYTHLISHTDFIKQLHETIVDIYMDHKCKKTRDELENLLKNETWYNATDYLKAGFVDEIL